MHYSLTFPIHGIPLWFLVLSLFLPRICILVAWLQHGMGQFIPHVVNPIEIIVAVLVPRILILFWIYQDQGVTIWFLLHIIALIIAWGGGGSRLMGRRHVVEVDG